MAVAKMANNMIDIAKILDRSLNSMKPYALTATAESPMNSGIFSTKYTMNTGKDCFKTLWDQECIGLVFMLFMIKNHQ